MSYLPTPRRLEALLAATHESNSGPEPNTTPKHVRRRLSGVYRTELAQASVAAHELVAEITVELANCGRAGP
jgi:hypothetical protein